MLSRTLTRLRHRPLVDTSKNALAAMAILWLALTTIAACSRPTSPPSSSSQSPGIAADAISQLDANHFQIRRDRLAEIVSFAANDPLRMVPTMRDGALIGQKLFVIKPGSLADRLGFENGDTLLELNDQPLVRPDAVFVAYQYLKGHHSSAGELTTVLLTRRGTAITLHYSIL